MEKMNLQAKVVAFVVEIEIPGGMTATGGLETDFLNYMDVAEVMGSDVDGFIRVTFEESELSEQQAIELCRDVLSNHLKDEGES